MSRLPIPNSDNGQWGEILNDFLRQSHNEDGTLKANIVSATQLIGGSVTGSKIAATTIDESRLSTAVQTKLNALAEATNGREIELRSTVSSIQWKYVDDTDWTDLINISDITGPKGDKGDKGDPGPKGDPGDTGPAGTTTWAGITDKPAITPAGQAITSAADAAAQRAVLGVEPPRGALTTIIGSSIARGGDSTRGIGGANITAIGPSWFSWGCAISGGRILRGPNCGIIGNTTAMILARITDVTQQPEKPDYCILYCGSNDAVAGVTPAEYAANVHAIIAALRAADITPILSTIVPSINGTEYVTCNTYNTLLRATARRDGLHLLDLHNLMVDPASGAQKPEFVAGGGDGVHPGTAGYALIGQYMSDVLSPHMPPAVVDLVTNPLDPTTMVNNGLYQGTVTDGRAASWGQETKPAGTVFSVEEDPTFALGKIQRITATAIASRASLFQYIDPPKFTPGDVVEMTYRFRVTWTAGGAAYLQLHFVSATDPAYLLPLTVQTSGSGTGRVRFTVPAGTTRIMLLQRVDAGTAVFDVAQMTMRNLTALGLA